MTGLLAAVFTVAAPVATQNAVANGDTRTISLYHTHTGESISATFRVDGQYDRGMLEKLNWFLRDWRTDQVTKMDPKLFDVIWETYRESGSRLPIQIVSAYRSPQTNSMLRRRSRAVAEHSQHMLGKAMDMHYQDVPMSKVREIAMRLQRGGVGYYPTAGTPFVHLDVGSVRAWPRMSYDQLVRLFPDGKTVHLPANGHPLARYAEARAEIDARNSGSTLVASNDAPRNFFASLFGRGDDEARQATQPARRAGARLARATATDLDDASEIQTPAQRRGAEALARAERNLPKGETVLGAPSQTAVDSPAPVPPRRPVEIALSAVPATEASVDVPLPPIRPVALAALRPTSRPDPFAGLLARAGDLPEVITQGRAPEGMSAPPVALPALAYAPDIVSGEPVRPPLAQAPRSPALAQPIGLRSAAVRHKPRLVAARLDRSNFMAFTRPGDIAQTVPRSQLGSATGLRAAAQVDAQALVFSPATPMTTQFGAAATDLTTSRFSGPAVRPLLQQSALTPDGSFGVATLTTR